MLKHRFISRYQIIGVGFIPIILGVDKNEKYGQKRGLFSALFPAKRVIANINNSYIYKCIDTRYIQWSDQFKSVYLHQSAKTWNTEFIRKVVQIYLDNLRELGVFECVVLE